MYRIYALLFLMPFNVWAQQQFSCDGSFYVVMKENQKSVLRQLWRDDADVLQGKTILLSEPQRNYTCLGLSVADLYLYALDFDTKELLKIDASGKVLSLGIPENLDTNLEYWAGDVMPEGRRLTVIGKDKASGIDRLIYNINLTIPNHYAGVSSLISNIPTSIGDIAIDPIRGLMFGYDKRNKQLVDIGTSTITHHNYKPVASYMEAIFFDKQGNLLGYGSDSEYEQNTLYFFDKIKGEILDKKSSYSGQFADGCSCAQTMSFTRAITPSLLAPCTEFEINYTIINHAGVGKTGITFRDSLPMPFIITEVLEHTFNFGQIRSSIGSNLFQVDNLDVIIGKNTIKIKGVVGTATQESFITQANLDNLPLGLGKQLLSDNPATLVIGDANTTTLLQSNSFELEDYVQYNCAKDTLTLSLPFQANKYQWNDGSKNPTLTITELGAYWIIATADCLTVQDTIQVLSFPDAPKLNLEDSMVVKQGTKLRLQPSTNLSDAVFFWSSQNKFDLSCETCVSPSLTAVLDNTYYLRVVRQDNCALTDSLHVSVIPVRTVFAPNAFSPNDDNSNDVFYLEGLSETAIIRHFQVLDRWGNILFQSQHGRLNDPSSGWNGKYKDEFAATGIYIWWAEVEFLDGEKKRLQGEVTLIKH